MPTNQELLDQIAKLGGETDTLQAAVNADAFGTTDALKAVLASLQTAPTSTAPAPAPVLPKTLPPSPLSFQFSPLPSGAPATTAGLTAATLASPTASPVAFGFPLFERTVGLILQAEESRRRGIQQTIDIQRLLVELQQTSPTRAADFAVRLGLPEEDFSFLGAFGSGQVPAVSGGGRIGGTVGSQQVSLPGTFSGAELTFLNANRNIAGVIQDVATKFGLPDIFSRSAAAAIPTSRTLAGSAG